MPIAARAAQSAADGRYRWRMGPYARWMVLVTAALLSFGLAVLYSASSIDAMAMGSSTGTLFLLRQLTGLAAGAIVFAIVAKVDAERLYQMAWPLMAFAIVSMFAVLILPESIAPRLHGSKRFLVGSSFQPSEFAKLSVIVWVSMLIVKKGDALRRLSKGLVPFLVVIGLLDALAVLEPDLSVAMLFTLLLGMLLYVGGARLAHFIFLGALSIPVLWSQVDKVKYAMARIASFIDPSTSAQVGYQLNQSLIGVGSGGLFGRGFGQGMQQFGFLPFPYSDFIGTNIGEEWGFVGLFLTTLAFALYALLGFRIARQARSQFLQLTAIGLTFTTVLTAYLHIGVVLGLLPTTGLTLPFISYGRSNLVLTLLFTGILVNIGSTREKVVGGSATDPMAARA